MAPSKRAASVSAGSDTKRKCQSVSKAVMGSQQLSISCKAMLSGMSTFALDTYAEDRHAWQSSVIDMLKTTLSGVEDTMKTTIAEQEGEVARALATKAGRADGLTSAESKLAASIDFVAQKKAAADEGIAALKAAKESLKDATSKQAAGDDDVNQTTHKLEGLEAFKKDAFNPLKEGTLSGAEANTALKSVGNLGKRFDLEKPMVQAVVEALKQAPTDRSAFLGTSVSQMEEKIDALIANLRDAVEKGKPGQHERAEAVATASAAQADAEAASQACGAALQDAHSAKKQADGALKVAQAACTNFLPDMKRLMDGFDQAQGSLQDFKASALVDLQELETLTPPPSVVEEEAPAAMADEAVAPPAIEVTRFA